MNPGTTDSRFWTKVSFGPKCWLWTASVNAKGYGQLFIARSPRIVALAHRLSWEIHNGTIPSGLCVLHRCDVPACVNPDHLFIGTKADNNADMKQKGRSTIGEKNPMAKLTEVAVRSILNDGRYQKDIAADFGIDQSLVSYIKSRKVWSHVQP